MSCQANRQVGPTNFPKLLPTQGNQATQHYHSCKFVSLTGSWKTLKAVVAMIQSGVRPMRSATTPWPAACRSNSSSGSSLTCTAGQQQQLRRHSSLWYAGQPWVRTPTAGRARVVGRGTCSLTHPFAACRLVQVVTSSAANGYVHLVVGAAAGAGPVLVRWVLPG